jgi:hypothetical protein
MENPTRDIRDYSKEQKKRQWECSIMLWRAFASLKKFKQRACANAKRCANSYTRTDIAHGRAHCRSNRRPQHGDYAHLARRRAQGLAVM